MHRLRMDGLLPVTAGGTASAAQWSRLASPYSTELRASVELGADDRQRVANLLCGLGLELHRTAQYAAR
jgi:hypothetical protein